MRQFMTETTWLVIVYVLLFVVWLLLFTDHARAESTEQIQHAIVQASVRHGVDPALALAIAEVESKFNVNAVGSLGEIGVFQLRPEFHHVRRGATTQNIEIGVKYLAQLKRRCGSYGDAFFVCFNYGTARKLKYPHLFPYYVRVKEAQMRRSNTHVIARAN
jgi:soluble lytic murein transglycosylase-like protein